MRRALLLALLLVLAGSAGAQDATGLGGLPLGKSSAGAIHAKSMSLPATYAFGARTVQAPVMAPTDSGSDATRHTETGNIGARAGCENSEAAFCYDAAGNHIVYRPARQYMPTVKGLTAENVSMRRHGIRFKYSFP